MSMQDIEGYDEFIPERDGLIDPLARRDAEVELNALAAELYGLGTQPFRFLMDTLFMTPKHREAHTRMRDDIAARLEKQEMNKIT